jgi:hypothetical protein
MCSARFLFVRAFHFISNTPYTRNDCFKVKTHQSIPQLDLHTHNLPPTITPTSQLSSNYSHIHVPPNPSLFHRKSPIMHTPGNKRGFKTAAFPFFVC